YQFLNDHSGLIRTMTYYAATTAGETTPGGVAGYEQSTSLKQGEFGTPILQDSTQYFLHTGGGATIAPVPTSTVSRNGSAGVVIGDPSFESPNVGTGSFFDFQYDPSGSPWTFAGGAGVAGNGSGFTVGNPDAPEGTQVAFLQDSAGSI